MENIYLETDTAKEDAIEEVNEEIEGYIIDENNYILITYREPSLFPLCP